MIAENLSGSLKQKGGQKKLEKIAKGKAIGLAT